MIGNTLVLPALKTVRILPQSFMFIVPENLFLDETSSCFDGSMIDESGNISIDTVNTLDLP